MMDCIELAEHRRDDDDLTVPLFARASGTRYYQEAADTVEANSRLLLVREPSNAKDEFAVMLCRPRATRSATSQSSIVGSSRRPSMQSKPWTRWQYAG